MLLLVGVLVQIGILLYCYELATRRNLRRMQLWVCHRLDDERAPVRIECAHHRHGLTLCAACCGSVLRGHPVS